MFVYVKNKNGKNLMPCKPAKARRLLKEGRAKVIQRKPFTIQLLWDCEENVQEVTVGIDKGAKETGFSCVSNSKILLSGRINHRGDVKKKMETRSGNRRQRRIRKWYRECRFDNRASSRRSNRIPPSIRTNVEEVLRIVKKITLPISRIVVEDVQIDIARLNNPDLQGKDYQKSNRLDENLRIAALMRDGYTCTHCGKKKVKLEVHHIIPRSAGGKDTIKNLTTLCSRCHKSVHKGKIVLKQKGVDGFKDRVAQRTMQGKTYMYKELEKIASVSKVFGYQTSEYRKMLGLVKEHDVDALCIATMSDGEVIDYNRDNFFQVNFRPEQTRRQYYDLPRKGKGRVRYQVNSELDGFKKGDIVLVKGFEKRIKSIKSGGYLAFRYAKGKPTMTTPKNCRLLEKAKAVIWTIESDM